MDLETFHGVEVCPGCQAHLINVRYGERLCQPCRDKADATPPSISRVGRVLTAEEIRRAKAEG